MDLRERLRRLMVEHDHTPTSLSRAAGVNQTFVRDVLDGRAANPRVDNMTKVATALEVSIEYLLEGRGETGETAEVVSLYSRIKGEKDKAFVKDMLRRLADDDSADEGSEEVG